jgi:hypothetical protein
MLEIFNSREELLPLVEQIEQCLDRIGLDTNREFLHKDASKTYLESYLVWLEKKEERQENSINDFCKQLI